jgi:hypothetical protein
MTSWINDEKMTSKLNWNLESDLLHDRNLVAFPILLSSWFGIGQGWGIEQCPWQEWVFPEVNRLKGHWDSDCSLSASFGIMGSIQEELEQKEQVPSHPGIFRQVTQMIHTRIRKVVSSTSPPALTPVECFLKNSCIFLFLPWETISFCFTQLLWL